MRRVLNERRVIQQFRCLPELGLVYLTNAKSASTTIKYSMVAAAAARVGNKPDTIEPHRRDVGPFIENIFRHPLFGSPDIRRMTVFSVVRNPFARALSGYLSKIIRGKTPEWREFAREFGLRADLGRKPVSFTEFLRLIDTLPDESINAHFRPQYINLLQPFSVPHFVGRLEAFDETARFLEGVGVVIADRRGLNTRSSDRAADHYTDEAEALVARKFAPDFELFGYAPSLAGLRELREPKWKSGGPDLLMDWLSGGPFPKEQLDPEARAYYEITAETDLEGKIARIRRTWRSENNWRYLAAYAKLARRAGRDGLARKLDDRIATLHEALRACVGNRDIFVPPESSAQSPASSRRGRKTRKQEGTKHDG